jgi:DNA-binding MarR family transcriptional regulator
MAKAQELNITQRRILKALHEVTTECGEPPTVVELAQHAIYSESHTAATVRELDHLGYINRTPNKWRSMVLTDKGRKALG